MTNPLQDQLAEILFQRIRGNNRPSATEMDMLEAIAPRRLRLAFALDLMDRIQDEPNPSISMMWRVRRLIEGFGN